MPGDNALRYPMMKYECQNRGQETRPNKHRQVKHWVCVIVKAKTFGIESGFHNMDVVRGIST